MDFQNVVFKEFKILDFFFRIRNFLWNAFKDSSFQVNQEVIFQKKKITLNFWKLNLHLWVNYVIRTRVITNVHSKLRRNTTIQTNIYPLHRHQLISLHLNLWKNNSLVNSPHVTWLGHHVDSSWTSSHTLQSPHHTSVEEYYNQD